MATLTPVVNDLKALAEREWSHCLKNVAEFSDRLLDVKETAIDPLKQFYAGPKRAIYDDIKTFLRDEAANFADVVGNEAAALREVAAAATPYKGSTLQQSKANLESLRGRVAQAVAGARSEAYARIEQARQRPLAMAEFGVLSSDEKMEIIQPFDAALADVQHEHLAPVIRQISDRVLSELLPRQLQRLTAMAAARNPSAEKPGDRPEPVQYVAARSIAVSAPKPVIETEQDLDQYLAAVRAAYLAELRRNRRITL